LIRRGALAGLLLGLAAAASAQTAPELLLQRMGAALSDSSYSGVVVYSRDGQLDALRIRHRAGAGERFELIERLTGPALPLQRDGQSARLGEGPRYASDLAAVGADAAIDPLGAYELRTVGEDRVAGRLVDVVDARARDAMRFSRRFWLDRDSGLLLRAATFGSDGIVVEQWMFSDLAIERGGDGAAAPVAGQTEPFRGARGSDIAHARLRVMDVPQGFRLVSAAVEPQREQLVFSDGLVTVSVFAEPLAAEATVMSGHQRRGALNVFGRLFRGLQIVVVGEVPAATAERFAQGVEAPGGG
jgi:sigma-E factor negative regulatory protein RseB